MSEYRHLIGGEVNGQPHEAGDPVDAATRPSKIKEWLHAGIIEKEKQPSSAGAKAPSDPDKRPKRKETTK